MKTKTLNKKLPAFTLPELLVVLVIIGILVLLALPNLTPLIGRANETEAKLSLGHIHTLQKSYNYLHSKYSEDLVEIGFEAEKLVTEGGSSKFLFEIVEASQTSYRATATAVVDFDGDGTYMVWEINQDKELKKTVRD